MEFHFEQGEMLLVRKPCNWTSFDVVGKVRSLIRKNTGLKKIRIGHAGTLDPLATGLLILCTGKFTKKIEEFQELEKEYTGTFYFGTTTPSFDLETEPDWQFAGPLPDDSQIREAFRKFTGTLEQVPPQFSAIKVDGKRAYRSARKNIPVEITPRRIVISAFDLTRVQLPEADFRVACSKGTYIRALARDVGQSLGCGAHLTSLCRTRIGPYRIEEAMELEQLEKILTH